MGRNSRRQQRLEEEQEEQDKEQEQEQEEEHTTDTEPRPTYQRSVFSSLPQDPSSDEEGDEEEEKQNNNNNQNQVQPSSSSKKKKRKPKKKKKTTTQTTIDDPSTTTANTTTHQTKQPKVDEIDQALIELAEKLPNSVNLGGDASDSKRSTHQEDLIIDELLKIDTRNLDHELELRRMFGARVVSSSSSNNAPLAQMYGPIISNNPHHHLNTSKLKSSILTKPSPLWPQLDKSSLGLSARKLSQEEVEARGLVKSDEWFKFEHSLIFRWRQSRFLRAIASSDPNQLVAILHKSPYHPDSLLQLSEVASHNEDRIQSINYVNQALYINEKTLNFRSSASSDSSTHNSKGLTLGHFRLDYNFAENRNFFRAVNFKLNFLVKQGCYKTAFETCKLLFSLNPYQDPYGSLFWIDFLSVKSNQHEFFLKFLEHLPHLQERNPKNRLFIEAFPGLHFTKALCMRVLEEKNHTSHEESDAALESALLRFPQALKPLAEAVGISLPAELDAIKILNIPFTSPENYPETPHSRVLHPPHIILVLCQIYAHRSSSLWKSPTLSTWLRDAILRVMPKFNNFKLEDTRFSFHALMVAEPYLGTFESVYRCMMASESDALKKFLPPWVFKVEGSYSFDPLPPVKGSQYDKEYFKDVIESTTYSVALSESDRVTRRREDVEEGDEGGEEEAVREEMRAEEEAEYIFSDGFDPARLVDVDSINRLITRLQDTVQGAHHHLSVTQFNQLLLRLDALFNRLNELTAPEAPQDPPHPVPDPDPDPSEPNELVADSETSFDHSHQMPGSFFNPPPP